MKKIAVPLCASFPICTFPLLAILLVVYANGTSAPQGEKNSPKLRLSYLPSTPPGGIRPTADQTLQDAQPLLRYLEMETGARIDMTVSKGYAASADALGNDEADVAKLGGLEYVQTAARSVAKPLVQTEEDHNWHSIFITQPDSKINHLKDLDGHTFVFGSVTSVSGHVMPYYFMRAAKVDPKVIETAIYSGAHDATALAIANKKAEAGVMDPRWLQAMIHDGKLTSQQVRIIWTSPRFADAVWAARSGLDAKLAESFSSALLKLNPKNPEHKKLLDFLSADKYIRAKDSDYDELRQAAKGAGLLK